MLVEKTNELNLNDKEQRDFPEHEENSPLDVPPPLLSRRVIGPSAVFTAVAIGSGELIFWPGLSLSYGAGVLWIALLAVGIQYLMNLEIGRYSLATGESVVVGATRLSKWWGVILLLGTIVPWLWPGWARTGSQLLGNAYGIPEKALTIFSLIICGILLVFPKNVYGLVEKLQTALLIFIIIGVVILFALALPLATETTSFWTSFFSGGGIIPLLQKATSARNADFLALLGGLVFAGAGGILNLGYGLLLCEKKFGMGKFSKPVAGLRHSFGLDKPEKLPELENDTETVSRWRRWLKLARYEHAALFVAGNTFTIIFLSLIFFCLIGASTNQQGISFLQTVSAKLGESYGTGASMLFIMVAFAILFTSEIGIIDITSRLAAGIVHATSGFNGISASLIYHIIVWFEIIVGITLTLADPRQPYSFLVTSAVLNILVMSIYTGLVAFLNRSKLPKVARTGRITTILMVIVSLLFLLCFFITLRNTTF